MTSEEMSALPGSAKEARASGAKHYFTGKPCKNGHIAPRWASKYSCIECEKAVTREVRRRYEEAYRSRNKEILRKRSRDGRLSDPDRFKTYTARWRSKNREHIIQKSKDVYAANPQDAASRWRKRRALIRGSEGVHSVEDIERIHASQNFVCAVCGTSTVDERNIDHIKPLSLGGSNWPNNIQILCPPCNKSKGNKDDAEFRRLFDLGLTASNDNDQKRVAA